MNGWTIVFIILCVTLGPVYVIGAVIGLVAQFTPGTRDRFPVGVYTVLLILLAVPFLSVGYMAFGGGESQNNQQNNQQFID